MTTEPRATVNVSLTVNGVKHTAEVEARLLLVHFIRENLDMTGTHIGCDTTNCGACTDLLDGHAIKSYTLLPFHAYGCNFDTVQRLAQNDHLPPLHQGSLHKHGLPSGLS